jgi:hypothetical protein
LKFLRLAPTQAQRLTALLEKNWTARIGEEVLPR